MLSDEIDEEGAALKYRERDEEKASLLHNGEGWSSERAGYRRIERAKGVILPLDLGEYRFCLHGG